MDIKTAHVGTFDIIEEIKAVQTINASIAVLMDLPNTLSNFFNILLAIGVVVKAAAKPNDAKVK